jgi:hypothetical protein
MGPPIYWSVPVCRDVTLLVGGRVAGPGVCALSVIVLCALFVWIESVDIIRSCRMCRPL